MTSYFDQSEAQLDLQIKTCGSASEETFSPHDLPAILQVPDV